ncbi:unnamed protein product [Vitrella brassicaformis CCMP3155]|uniref:Cwf19-like C-terminal domain-containing protein n=2 Tax=Vitrella brassicaformis TaxID=1169539 RepID=A0A0G4F763_VITBC|nr:unnamed protein product [Vitrella brassicaformis CCMP3155]|eukprot:CEM08538.1 unnamed protein product [Vitrella brassicaformis CCMP3155]
MQGSNPAFQTLHLLEEPHMFAGVKVVSQDGDGRRKKSKKDKKSKKSRRRDDDASDSSGDDAALAAAPDVDAKDGDSRGARDDWMLSNKEDGDAWLDSLGSEVKKPDILEEKRKQQEAAEKAIHPLELNPYLRKPPEGGERPGETPESDGPSSGAGNVPAHLCVGDGGRRWRNRAIRRAKEQAEATGASVDEVVGEHFGEGFRERDRRDDRGGDDRGRDHRGRGDRGWERRRDRNRDWEDRRDRRDDDRDWRERRRDQDSSDRRERRGQGWRRSQDDRRETDGPSSDRPPPPSNGQPAPMDVDESPMDHFTALKARYTPAAQEAQPSQDDQQPETSEKPRGEEEGGAADYSSMNANELSSLAMKAMLAGNMDEYHRLNAALKLKQTSDHLKPKAPTPEQPSGARAGASAGGAGQRVEVIEEVDSAGRMRTMVSSVAQSSALAKGKKRLTHEEGKSYYADDAVSLEQLLRREKVEGVQDYDANYAGYIVRKGKRFKELHEDEDESYALGRYESREKVADPRKKAHKERQRLVRDKQRLQKKSADCSFCMESDKFAGRLDCLISQSFKVYLCFQSFSQASFDPHLFIAPIPHVGSVTNLDEDVYDELRNYQKCLVRYFDARNQAPIFIETVRFFVSPEKAMMGGGPHTIVEVVAVPADRLQEAKTYFSKAFGESGSEWSQNKKIVPTSGKTGVRGRIPKNFPYVHVDFSLTEGLGHVIEDTEEFPRNFARDVLLGMLEMTSMDKPFVDKKSFYAAVKAFKEGFQPFDWTAALK